MSFAALYSAVQVICDPEYDRRFITGRLESVIMAGDFPIVHAPGRGRSGGYGCICSFSGPICDSLITKESLYLGLVF